MNYKKYKRKEFSEIREVNELDIKEFKKTKNITSHYTKDNTIYVSISDVDLLNGSPKIGDMIARNPKNHLDKWLIAEKYFKENFE